MEVDNILDEVESEKRLWFEQNSKSKRQYARYVRKRVKNNKRTLLQVLSYVVSILFILYWVNLFTGVKFYFPFIEYAWIILFWTWLTIVENLTSEFKDIYNNVDNVVIDFDEENDYRAFVLFAKAEREFNPNTYLTKIKSFLGYCIYMDNIKYIEYDDTYKCMDINFKESTLIINEHTDNNNGEDEEEYGTLEDSSVIIFDCFDKPLLEEFKRYGIEIRPYKTELNNK